MNRGSLEILVLMDPDFRALRVSIHFFFLVFFGEMILFRIRGRLLGLGF